MDHFGEDPEFIDLGEATRDPFLEAAIAQIAAQLFGGKRDVVVTKMLLTRLPEQQFIHGGIVLGGKMGNVLYFEDIHVGLLALIWSVEPSETKMARFTGRQ